jgi:chorismate synthase
MAVLQEMIDFDAIQMEMSLKKTGQSAIVTQRKEPDDVQFLSGILKVKHYRFYYSKYQSEIR